MAKALTIGQLAKATGVATTTIRYYEGLGVLPSPTRTAAGYRQYDERSIVRLRFLGRARALGLSLEDLKALAATLDGGPRPAMRSRLLALVRRQLSAVRQRAAELQLLQRQLEQVLQRLLTPADGNGGGECRCLETGSVPAPGARRGARHR